MPCVGVEPADALGPLPSAQAQSASLGSSSSLPVALGATRSNVQVSAAATVDPAAVAWMAVLTSVAPVHSRYSNGARASARSSRSRSPARRPHLLHGQHPSHASRRSGGGRDSRATGRSGRSSRATRDRSGRDYSRDYNRDYSRDRRNDRYSRRSRSQSSQESGSLSSDDDGSSGDERDDSEGHFKGKAGSMIDGRCELGVFRRVSQRVCLLFSP